jgi:hypothetical protein
MKYNLTQIEQLLTNHFKTKYFYRIEKSEISAVKIQPINLAKFILNLKLSTGSKNMFKVYCAWCLKQGKKTIINYSNIDGAHGICKDCLKIIEQELIEYDKIKGGDKNVR